MVVPFMTIYATQRLGFSITQAGIIMALFGAGSIFGAYIGGKLTDTFGFYRVQLLALLGGGVMFILLGQMTGFVSICTTTFFLSVINEAFRPANAAAIAVYSRPENRTRSFSLNRLAINLGWAFGGSLGGFLAAKNYTLLFWVDGITNISAAVLLLLVLPKPPQLTPGGNTPTPDRPVATSAYADGRYWWFIVLTILFSFCFFQMFTILPVYYRTRLQISEQEIGILMALNGLIIAVVEMVLVYKMEQTRRPFQFITYGVWLTGLSFGLLNMFNGRFGLALSAELMITLGEMLAMPFMNTYWISRSNDSNRGQYAGLYTMAWGTAQVIGPSLGGWVADHLGFHILWWMIFAISLVTGVGYYFLTKDEKSFSSAPVAG